MKKLYPVFKVNHKESESEKAFQSLSEKNKKAIEQHLVERETKSKSIKRLGNRKRGLIRLLYFLEKDFDKINYDDYVCVASAISKSNLGVDIKNMEKNFIKRFLKDNYEDAETRFKKFELLSGEIKEEKDRLEAKDLLTSQEVETLIKATPSMKYKCLIAILSESAGRPEEVLKTKWCDVDFKQSLIYLYSIKTKRKRAIPLNNSIQHLRRWRNENNFQDDDYIFFSTRTNRPLTNSMLNLLLKDLAEKTKMKKNVFPYLFRHSTLSLWITKLSPKVYETISGHSLEMGMKNYAHLSKDLIISEMNEKVFQIEEMSDEKKNELQIKIEKQQEQLDFLITRLLKEDEKDMTKQERQIVKEIFQI